MTMPGFNAEVAIGPPKGRYQAETVFGTSGGLDVLPMMPRPTVSTAWDCLKGGGDADRSEGVARSVRAATTTAAGFATITSGFLRTVSGMTSTASRAVRPAPCAACSPEWLDITVEAH